ncbi:hypothetical protein ABN228_20500 [Providencia rettgeri]|uniref:hypothetical protein n=1 Tax=Providencia rettgeri TaxID=587 RepID=UPI0032D9EDCB
MTSRSQKLRNKTTLSVAIIWIGSLWLSISANTQPLLQGLVAQELFVEPHSTDSCSISMTEVSYPYTQLSAALFHPTQKNKLPPMTQTLQVICSVTVSQMTMEVVSDTQASSVTDADPTHFGLGHVNGQGSLGYYQVKLDEAKIGSDAVQLYHTADENAVGTLQSSLFLQSSGYQGWAKEGGSPASGQQFSVNMTVLPTLSSLKETHGPLVDGANLNGELVLRFPFSI